MRLFLRADNDIEAPPTLGLVNNPSRLPLEQHDGQHIELDSPAGPVPHCRIGGVLRAGRVVPTEWTFDIGRLRGYLRLFVTGGRRTRQVALFDPPLRFLYIPDQMSHNPVSQNPMPPTAPGMWG